MATRTIRRSSQPRRRDAAATRAAILQSARSAFLRAGYDGVGVREIAACAGVTAMLVNRYFGSKEGLFSEVAGAASASPIILAPENLNAADLTKRMASALVRITEWGDTPLDGFLILLRSASSERAAEIGRKQITDRHLRSLAAALSGAHRQERAALALSVIAGFQVMRQMIGLPALASADAKVLEELLVPLFRYLVEKPRK